MANYYIPESYIKNDSFMESLETVRQQIQDKRDNGYNCGEYANAMIKIEEALNYLLHRKVRRENDNLSFRHLEIPEQDRSREAFSSQYNPCKFIMCVYGDHDGSLRQRVEIDNVVPADIRNMINNTLYHYNNIYLVYPGTFDDNEDNEESVVVEFLDINDRVPPTQWLINHEQDKVFEQGTLINHEVFYGGGYSRFFAELSNKAIKEQYDYAWSLRDKKHPGHFALVNLTKDSQGNRPEMITYNLGITESVWRQQAMDKMCDIVTKVTNRLPFGLAVALPGAVFYFADEQQDKEIKEQVDAYFSSARGNN